MFESQKILSAILAKQKRVKLSSYLNEETVSNMVNEAIKSLSVKDQEISYSISWDKKLFSATTTIEFNYHPNRIPLNPIKEYKNQKNIQPKKLVERKQFETPPPQFDRRPPHQDPLPVPIPIPIPIPNKEENNKEDGVYDISDVGQSSFKNDIRLANGYIFDIHTGDTARVAKIIQKEAREIITSEEGINRFTTKSSIKNGQMIFRIEFSLGMPLHQFLDHREKGNRYAENTLKVLTHNGVIPPDVLALLVYGYLQKNVSYDKEYAQNSANTLNGDEHMAYGALVKKKCVCEGYAWAFVRIFEKANIPAKLVTGTYKKSPHAWAKVNINGLWYHVDPTLSKPPVGINVVSLLWSDQRMRQQGYDFDNSKDQCRDTSYEDIRPFLNKVESNKNAYIAQGASKEYLDGPFYVQK